MRNLGPWGSRRAAGVADNYYYHAGYAGAGDHDKNHNGKDHQLLKAWVEWQPLESGPLNIPVHLSFAAKADS
jgi:hypothetical protein